MGLLESEISIKNYQAEKFLFQIREASMGIQELLLLIYIFVLATFSGFELISKVPPNLHTPLM
ncbi:MAG: NAD(P) transhydrogenase subunit alpha, partial [Leptospiraceae bacterium]|nr:NAD(P) transhydrogenase subunit alpha [Leptospiraceae bacterium]